MKQESRRPDLYYESADERVFSYKGRIYAREFVVVEKSHSDVTYRRIVQISPSRDSAGKAANRRNIAAWDSMLLRDHVKQNPTSLYSSFHGANPTRVREISFEPPKPGEKLIAIGRVTQINYRPYGSSRRKGTEFFHKLGDTGERMNPEKPILAVSQDGKRFYLIRDESKMHFSERGIIS